MDNPEGGLDYLREVILNDSPGIAHELEQEMARVVETYQCEWQTTLNDPDRRAVPHCGERPRRGGEQALAGNL